MKQVILGILAALLSSTSTAQSPIITVTDKKLPDSTLTKVYVGIMSAVMFLPDEKNRDESIKELMLGIKILDEQMMFNPENGLIYVWRGVAKQYLNRLPEAIADYTKAIKLMPDDFKQYESRGKCKKQLQDYLGATNDFTKALSLTDSKKYPDYSELYYERAVCYTALKKYDAALQDFNAAIALNKNNCLYYLGRGAVKSELYNSTSGCSDLSTAGELGCHEAYDFIKDMCH